MAPPQTVVLQCDAAPAYAALDLLRLQLDRELPAEFLQEFRAVLCDGFADGAKLFRLDGAPPRAAAVAGECRLLLQPSDLFYELLAALRAGDRDFERIGQILGHLSAPSAGSATPMIAEFTGAPDGASVDPHHTPTQRNDTQART